MKSIYEGYLWSEGKGRGLRGENEHTTTSKEATDMVELGFFSDIR